MEQQKAAEAATTADNGVDHDVDQVGMLSARVEDQHDWLDKLQQRADIARDKRQDAMRERDALRSKVKKLRKRLDAAEATVEELKADNKEFADALEKMVEGMVTLADRIDAKDG